VIAQGPSGEWVSNVYCVNHEADPAEITLAFYEGDTLAASFSDTIPANGSKYYYPDSSGMPDDFKGALSIASNENISCSSQTSSTATGTTVDPFRYASSGGFDINTAAPVMYAMQVLKNFDSGVYGFYGSYIGIQNTSNAPVDVLIEYTDRNLGAIPAANETFTIGANGSKIVYPEENANLPDNFFGSAKISSVDPTSTSLAVQIVIYNNNSSTEKAQFLMYNGTAQGESVLYAPYVMRSFYDFKTGMVVVNAGTTATSFKIDFNIGRDTVTTYTYQHPSLIQPGQPVNVFLPDIDALDPVDLLAEFNRSGNAVIYATDISGNLNPSGQLIANVNYRNDGLDVNNPNYAGMAATYNAVGIDQAAQTLYIPNIQSRVGGAEFTSGIQITNLTSSQGSCDIEFIEDPDANYSVDILANGIYVILVSNITNLNVGYNSAAVVTCEMDAAIIATFRANASSFYGDSSTVINVP
jgi:hypothetical protein